MNAKSKTSANPKGSITAVIIFEGVQGKREPSARLSDGREFPMGWNLFNSKGTYPIGTKGWARFFRAGSYALWEFCSEEEVQVKALDLANRFKDHYGVGSSSKWQAGAYDDLCDFAEEDDEVTSAAWKILTGGRQ